MGKFCSSILNHLKSNAPLLKSTSIYLLTAALTAGTPLLLLPFLTRALTPAEYGKVAMFTAAVQIFGITTGLSAHGAVGMKYFERSTLDFPRFVASCLLLLLASATVTLLIAWVALRWLEQLTSLPGHWLLMATLLSAATFVVQLQLSIWQSSKEAAKFAGLRAVQGVTELLASVVLVLVLGFSWQGRVGGIVLAGLAAAACALLTLIRGNWLRLPQDASHVRSALRFGLPLIPHAAGGLLIAMSDRLLITNILDISFTGIYLVASQLGMVLYIASDALHRAYSPLLIETLKHDDPDRDRKVVRLTYIYFAGLFLVALAFGAVAPALLSTLVGPKFQAAGSIFIFISIGQAFGGMYLMVATYIFWAGRTGYLAMITLTAGAANLGITYWLLSQRGLVGAAESFMVTQFLFFLGAWALAQRCRPMPWFSAIGFEPTFYAKACAVGLAMFGYASIFIQSTNWGFLAKSNNERKIEGRELIDASFAGNVELITKLLAAGADVNAADQNGITPLIAASSSLQKGAVELLLSHAADPSLKTKEGFTASDFLNSRLIDASSAGNVELIAKLLAAGADVNATDQNGITPLIAASSSLQKGAVELLLSHAADPSLKTKQGFTAYDFAKNQLNDDLASLLIVRDDRE